MRPLYEATAKIEIDHPGGGGVVGPEAAANNNPVNDMDQIVTTNLEAITAGAVLAPSRKPVSACSKKKAN